MFHDERTTQEISFSGWNRTEFYKLAGKPWNKSVTISSLHIDTYCRYVLLDIEDIIVTFTWE